MADQVAEITKTVDAVDGEVIEKTTPVLEKAAAEVEKNGKEETNGKSDTNGKAAEDCVDKAEENGEAEAACTLKNGSKKETGENGLEETPDVCSLKRKSDVSPDAVDGTTSVVCEKKAKVDEATAEVVEAAANGDAAEATA